MFSTFNNNNSVIVAIRFIICPSFSPREQMLRLGASRLLVGAHGSVVLRSRHSCLFAARSFSSQLPAAISGNEGVNHLRVAALGAAALVTAMATNTVNNDADVPSPAPQQRVAENDALILDNTNEYQRKSNNLPTFSLEKFREGVDDRVWVAMDGGVYDVTPFLDAHPGGVTR